MATNNGSHIFLAMLSGAVAGAAVALLMSPKSGREMREQLADYWGTAKDKINRVPDAFRSFGCALKDREEEEQATGEMH